MGVLGGHVHMRKHAAPLRIFASLHRMLLEELVGGVEHHAAGIRIADGFDFGGRHGVGFVAEVIADEGEDVSDFLVLEHAAEGRHGDLAVVFLVADLDGSHEAVHGDLDEALLVAGDPGAVHDAREGGIESGAVWLMAGDAVPFAEIDLLTYWLFSFSCSRRGN